MKYQLRMSSDSYSTFAQMPLKNKKTPFSMRLAGLFVFLFLFAGTADAQEYSDLRPAFELQSGDLLFFRDSRSGMGKAIKESTGRYTHVALVERDSANVWIIEATPEKGVQREVLGSENRPYESDMEVYRLVIPFDTAAVIARAKSYVGQPYDDRFLPDNGALYCSELIFEAFLDSDGNHLFPSQPMNFRNKRGRLPKYWKNHFKKLGMEVPEGVEGTNPTDMSRSPLIMKVF